jgi:hypothetical protein
VEKPDKDMFDPKVFSYHRPLSAPTVTESVALPPAQRRSHHEHSATTLP